MSSLSPLKQPVALRKTSLRIVPKPIVEKAIAHKQVSTIALRSQATQDAALHKSLHEIEIPLGELPNSDLVVRCQTHIDGEKDRAAFEELVHRYQRYVDKLLYHLASDWSDRADLAQEVWIRVYRSIHRLKEPAKFKSWVGRITTNLFYDELRKRKRFKGSVSLDAPRHSSDGQYDWELPSGEPTPADTMMTQEFHDHLKSAMAELPEVFQKTIAMRELQGLSYEEIANITGVSLGTVKSRIARARQRLQEKLNIYLVPESAAKKAAK
ncbi:MAG: sigma-70 family RNA polymerase sigma factor [Cyanobacteria bacterium J06598_1]